LAIAGESLTSEGELGGGGGKGRVGLPQKEKVHLYKAAQLTPGGKVWFREKGKGEGRGTRRFLLLSGHEEKRKGKRWRRIPR